jgi:hypothetical protein
VEVPRSYIAVEPRVRRLIAARLAVDPGSLRPEQELHLDRDALHDVARALERTFSVALEDPDIARVRCCRDLSMLVARRVMQRDHDAGNVPPVTAWIRVIPTDPKCHVLERLADLTPYMVQTVLEDVRSPGRCRRLEVILGPAQPQPALAKVERLFELARAAGLTVEVRRGVGPGLERRPASGSRQRSRR